MKPPSDLPPGVSVFDEHINPSDKVECPNCGRKVKKVDWAGLCSRCSLVGDPHKQHSGYPLLGKDQCPECLYQKPAPRYVTDADAEEQRSRYTFTGKWDEERKAWYATRAALLEGLETATGELDFIDQSSLTARNLTPLVNELRALAAQVRGKR